MRKGADEMYKGKYSRERRRRPALWAALALALVLTLTAGGTVAYLFTNTDAVTNTFTPANTGITIVENFDGEVKEEITVKNTGDIPVYVRVMLVASYQKEVNGKYEVCGSQHTPEVKVPDFTLGTDWVKGDDGYYYYTKSVSAQGETGSLIATDSSITLTKDPDHDGYVMHIDVLAQAIQAEPDSVVNTTWSNSKVTVTGNSGTLTVKTKTN